MKPPIGYIQFAEDYFELITDICSELKNQCPAIRFCGTAIRRKTALNKVEKIADSLGIDSCVWWNDIERDILSKPYDPHRLEHYQNLLGTRKLRKIIAADRELGHGLISGGFYEETPLIKQLRNNDKDRWKLIIGMLDYFFCEFERLRPAFVFLNEMTFSWELAMYFAATELGIPCLTLLYLRPTESYMITDNPYDHSDEIENCYQQALHEPATVADTMKKARLIVNNFQNRQSPPLASTQIKNKIQKQTSRAGMLKTLAIDCAKVAAVATGAAGTKSFIRQCSAWQILKTNLRVHRTARKILLRKNTFEPFEKYKNENYIYYPFHVEPEASIMVRSERFSNQFAFIEQLSKNMPLGYRLLVKEHLPMIGKRPSGFYEQIAKLPDVHLISPFANGFELVKQAQLVCVLTGTSGWEAIQFGKPVLALGDAQYLSIGEGYRKLQDFLNMDSEIEEAMQTPPVSKERLELFVASVLKCQTELGRRCFSYFHYGQTYSDVRSQDGVCQITEQILDQIAECPDLTG